MHFKMFKCFLMPLFKADDFFSIVILDSCLTVQRKGKKSIIAMALELINCKFT